MSNVVFLILAFRGLIDPTLTRNMRLETSGFSTNLNLKDFVDWIIKIEDGTFGSDNDGEADIEIPIDLLILELSSPLRSIIEVTYPNLLDNM